MHLSTLSNYGRSCYTAFSFRETLSTAHQNRVLRHPTPQSKTDLTELQTDNLKSVDQSSCNSFSELIHEYVKRSRKWLEAKNDQHTARNAWSDIINCNLKNGLNL